MGDLNILFAEDDRHFRTHVAERLARYGVITPVASASAATAALDKGRFSLAFIDLNLKEGPEMEGLDLIDRCKDKGVRTVVLSSHDQQDIVLRAFQRGCDHYFVKAGFEEALERRVGGLLQGLSEAGLKQKIKKGFITRNKQLLDKLTRIAELFLSSEQNILITGATGTGKSTLARLLHSLSPGRTPFVHLNLAELPESLIESELFGHTKGAFTGAHRDKPGLLAAADKGVLFLDEIGVAPPTLQKKLLKAIERKRFCPVGATREVRSNFRLISATCDDLPALMERGEFRTDFYFRLKGPSIRLPSLRENREDILPLIHHFISRSPRKIALSPEAERVLQNHSWPGNVRELENLTGELIGGTRGLIEPPDLPLKRSKTPSPPREKEFLSPSMHRTLTQQGLGALIKEIEKESLRLALGECGGRLNETTRFLRISKGLTYRILGELRKGQERD